jgi:CheY-like chemotaxis protein
MQVPQEVEATAREAELLPVSTYDPAAKRIAILSSLPSQPVKKAATPKRVLVIEDNLDSVHSLVLLLREMGHEVEYAINGYAGLDMAARMRPDVIFLDLGLPGLDGFDVCSRIKASRELKAARVIAITAYAQDEYRVRSKAVGCEQHLLKPVQPSALASVLE